MRRALTIAVLAASLLLSPLAGKVALAATLPVNHAQFVTRVIDLVNAERQRAGLPPLVANGPLTRAAQAYAGVLDDGTCFAHDCGSTLSQRIDQVGYTTWSAIGENIALGQSTPEEVMSAWMGSSGHRANILSSAFKEIGVGLALKPTGALVWVQDFGAAGTPVVTPPANCSVRPAFSLHTRSTAPGVLEVTVTAGTTAGAPNNALRSVRVGAPVNGIVDVPGYGHVLAGTTVGIAPGTRQATLVVTRITRGVATTVPLVLTDACGDWRTFVGAGPNAM